MRALWASARSALGLDFSGFGIHQESNWLDGCDPAGHRHCFGHQEQDIVDIRIVNGSMRDVSSMEMMVVLVAIAVLGSTS